MSQFTRVLADTFGMSGWRNVAAWGVAGGLAYWMWIIPQQRDEANRKAIGEEWKAKYAEQDRLKLPKNT